MRGKSLGKSRKPLHNWCNVGKQAKFQGMRCGKSLQQAASELPQTFCSKGRSTAQPYPPLICSAITIGLPPLQHQCLLSSLAPVWVPPYHLVSALWRAQNQYSQSLQTKVSGRIRFCMKMTKCSSFRTIGQVCKQMMEREPR